MKLNPKKARPLVIALPLFCLYILPSCKKEDKVPPLKYGEVNLCLSVKSRDSVDLCNPASPGAFTTANTDLFYLANGQYKRVEGQTFHPYAPENLMFFQHNNGKYQVLIIPSTGVDDRKISSTLVKFGTHVPDTIKVQYEIAGHQGIAVAAWVNGKKAELGGTNTPFTLIK